MNMNESNSVNILRDGRKRILSYDLSPNDEYLSILSSNQEKKLDLQIIDLSTRKAIIIMTTARINFFFPPTQIRFSKDSKYLYLAFYGVIQCICLSKRQQLFMVKCKHNYILSLCDLEYGAFVCIDMDDLKICMRNKTVRKLQLKGGPQRLDYNQQKNLLLIVYRDQIVIFSIIALRIIYELCINSYSDKIIQSMLFQDCLLSLENNFKDEKRGVLRIWGIRFSNSIIKEIKCSNILTKLDIISFEVGFQKDYIVLFCQNEISIIDKYFQIKHIIFGFNLKLGIIEFKNHQQSSKNKICQITQQGVEIFTPQFM